MTYDQLLERYAQIRHEFVLHTKGQIVEAIDRIFHDKTVLPADRLEGMGIYLIAQAKMHEGYCLSSMPETWHESYNRHKEQWQAGQKKPVQVRLAMIHEISRQNWINPAYALAYMIALTLEPHVEVHSAKPA